MANGEKYYIGNGNEAEMVSTLGKVKDGTDDYAFFVTNYRHKAYELKKNVISHQEYVSNFALHDYPISRGRYPFARVRSLGCGAQYREHRQVQHRPGLHRRGRALLL